jgi:L-threonylcarbamoyladenylate synthase
MLSNKAQIFPYSKESIVIGGERIKEGLLVSFPTETVYGLGANALDSNACISIFEAKGKTNE